ncbi:hypothetical protein BDZ94DRAFT_1247903 [Collybia nuda]|uniref:DUF6533 domain-containing protein n=1 Tax=Collybia nuda TaxID=64659 RepID=A0A9P6CPP0_9AGAR|nr:hypothetical protein BDZ94DRAFT_1247903 [Collybia nuda]
MIGSHPTSHSGPYNCQVIQLGSAIALFGSCTILVYDHLLTLSNEVEYIWRKKVTPCEHQTWRVRAMVLNIHLVSILFLVNRYFAVSTMFSIILLNVTDVEDACQLPGLAISILSSVTVLVAEAILILRTYAVYHKSKAILGLLLTIWLTHLSLMISIIADHISTKLFGVALALGPIPGLFFITPAVFFDAVVGVLLTLGLYQKYKSGVTDMPLVQLIIQDGLLYFGIVFAINITWIVVHIAELSNLDTYIIKSSPLETWSVWSACITTTMIGRLTLNLRTYDSRVNEELVSQATSLQFQNSYHHASTR